MISFFFGVKFLFFTTTTESLLVGVITAPVSEGSVVTVEVTVVFSGLCLRLQLYTEIKRMKANKYLCMGIISIPFLSKMLPEFVKHYATAALLYLFLYSIGDKPVVLLNTVLKALVSL